MSSERLCPICRKPLVEGEAVARYRPFCSKRCADVDLSRWLGGRYAIPAVEDETVAEGETAGKGAEGSEEEGARPPSRARH